MPSLDSMAEEAEKVLRKLDQEAAERAGDRNGNRRARQPQLAQRERDVAVLYGMYHGWSDALTARRFHISKNTVLRVRRGISEDPWKLFQIPILHRGLSGKATVWRCEACDASMRCTEREARTHVARHFVSIESLASSEIMP